MQFYWSKYGGFQRNWSGEINWATSSEPAFDHVILATFPRDHKKKIGPGKQSRATKNDFVLNALLKALAKHRYHAVLQSIPCCQSNHYFYGPTCEGAACHRNRWQYFHPAMSIVLKREWGNPVSSANHPNRFLRVRRLHDIYKNIFSLRLFCFVLFVLSSGILLHHFCVWKLVWWFASVCYAEPRM